MSKNDPMKSYMHDIGDIPLVSKDEEVVLADLIKNGNEEARHKLIVSNLRLVVKIAHDFKGYGLPLLDLISEGNIGLMRAAEKFDPEKGAKFSSYSAWWIKQSMRRALSQKSRTIRVPVASAGKISKIRQAKIQLAEELGRDPSEDEIAQYLNLTKRTVQGLKVADFKTFSLHDPIQKGEEGSFEDIIPDTSAIRPDMMIEGGESIERLRDLIVRLDEREREILTMRFGLEGSPPMTLEEVSIVIGRTRERVRQIQMHALKKLRTMIDDEDLERQDAINKGNCLIDQDQLEKRQKKQLGKDAIAFPYHDLIQCTDSISELRLSTRSMNSLQNAGLISIGALGEQSERDLMRLRYFGDKCCREVKKAITDYYLRVWKYKKKVV